MSVYFNPLSMSTHPSARAHASLARSAPTEEVDERSPLLPAPNGTDSRSAESTVEGLIAPAATSPSADSASALASTSLSESPSADTTIQASRSLPSRILGGAWRGVTDFRETAFQVNPTSDRRHVFEGAMYAAWAGSLCYAAYLALQSGADSAAGPLGGVSLAQMPEGSAPLSVDTNVYVGGGAGLRERRGAPASASAACTSVVSVDGANAEDGQEDELRCDESGVPIVRDDTDGE